MRIAGQPDWFDAPLSEDGHADRDPVNSYRLYRERLKPEPFTRTVPLKQVFSGEREYKAHLRAQADRIRRYCEGQMQRRSLSDAERHEIRSVCEQRARALERKAAR